MIPTIVFIPTRYSVKMLGDLLPALLDRTVTHIWIGDNGLPKEERYQLDTWRAQIPIMDVWEAQGLSIYQMWNKAWEKAQAWADPNANLAILNDDIFFLPDTLEGMAAGLRTLPELAAVCPNYNRPIWEGISDDFTLLEVKSTYGAGGLAGFCFMFRVELHKNLGGPLDYIDETYKWWYGDDDLVMQIEHAGLRMGRIEGLPITHAQGSSFRKAGNLDHQIVLDRNYFNQKWGEHRT